VDPVLGPEMRSTGEVMGIAETFGSAFAKSQLAASNGLPLQGTVLVTVNARDKAAVTPIARKFHEMGFSLVATTGTATHLRTHGIPVSTVYKVHEGRPNCLDMILNGGVQLLVNTPLGKHAQRDDYTMRQAAIRNHVAYTTTLSAARAAADAILSLKSQPATVRSLQEWQQDIVRPEPVGT
jgi:carbamoyl-phosphate synthase large subunit